MKRVTICVPTYNSEATLRATLDSVLAQTYSNLVVKIFDNASIDKTVQIAREYAMKDQRVQVFAHPENVGGEGNFNRCIQAADGEYMAIYHADDVYEPDMVAKQVEFLETQAESVAVATGASIIDENGVQHGQRFLPPPLRHRDRVEFRFEDLLRMTLKYGNFITCPSVMARANVYRDQIGKFRGDLFGTSSDLDVWLRFAKLGSFGLLTAPLMRYRVSEASFTVRETKRRFTEHDLLRTLRHYVTDKEDGLKVTARDLRYLKFHELKDAAARRLNIVTSGRMDHPLPDFRGSWSEILPMTLESRYHLKFIAASLVIFLFTTPLKWMRIFK